MFLSRIRYAAVATVIGLLTLAGLVHASITSDPVTVFPIHGKPVDVGLSLNTDQPVAGIAGQINFNPDIFSEPTVFPGTAIGFFTLGNEIEPGAFRFVVYADPTMSLPDSGPQVIFRLKTSIDAPFNDISLSTYSLESASTPQGQSISPVEFADVQAVFGGTAVELEWLRYR